MSAPFIRVFHAKAGEGTTAWPKGGALAMRGTVVTLAEALTRRWPTDAYAVQYQADDDHHTGAMRLSVDAPRAGVVVVLAWWFADVDDPATHNTGAPAREEWRAQERERVRALLADVPGVFVYETRGGYRIVARLPTAHTIATDADVEAWRDAVARRLAWLSRRYGIVGDSTCHDWPRFMRLPRVTRDGVAQELATVGDPHAVGEWPALDAADLAADLEEIARLAAAGADVPGKSHWASHLTRMRPPSRPPPPQRGQRSRAVASPPPSIAEIGPAARAVADALLALPRGGRHAVLQSVVGTALDAGWSRAHLDAFGSELAAGLAGMRAASDPGEVSRLVDDSWRRRETGGAYRGRTSLRDEAPEVADALDAAIAAVSEARADGMAYPSEQTLRATVPGASIAVPTDSRADRWRRDLDARPRAVEVSADEAGPLMHTAARGARDRAAVLLMVATAGAGKTVAVCREAAESSRNGGYTALLAPSHAVARQMLSHLAAAGAVGVVHLHGLLALHDDAGDPVCQKADAVGALLAAGVDAGEVACEGRHYGRRDDDRQGRLHLPMLPPPSQDSPCEHLDACPAYAARRLAAANVPGALVLVTVHQLAAVASEFLRGKPHAMVIIDEAPSLISAASPTVADLRAGADRIDARRGAVAAREAWRGPALRALAEGTARLVATTTATDAPPAVASMRALLADGHAHNAGALIADDELAQVDRWTAASARYVNGAGEAVGGVRKRPTPRPSSRVRAGTMKAPDAHTADLAAIHLAGVVAAALVAEGAHAARLADARKAELVAEASLAAAVAAESVTIAAAAPFVAEAQRARDLARDLAAEASGVRVEVGTRTRGELSGAPEIRISVVNPALRALLTNASIGRVLLDATADPRVLGAVLGAPVEVCRVDVADGAPVTRTFIPWAHGTRTDCLPDGADGPIAWEEFASPFVEALAVASAHLTRGQWLAVFTWRPIALALAGTTSTVRRAVLRADALDTLRDAADRGDLWAGAAAAGDLSRPPPTLPPMLADALADLDARGVRVTFSHYGHTRGRDDWMGADALLHAGSPWPDVAQVEQECAAVGLAAVAGDVGRHLAEAELEQACGRGRAPRRTAPLAVVVLATVPPKRADARWAVRALAVGRPVRHDHKALAARAAVVGVREAAREAGCDRATVQRAVRRVGMAPLLAEGGGGAQLVSEIPPELCAPPPPPPTSTVRAPYAPPALASDTPFGAHDADGAWARADIGGAGVEWQGTG